MPVDSRSLPFKKGDILSDYAIVAIEVQDIASGGFGLVAFGRDIGRFKGRWFALKTIRPEVLRRGKHIRDLFIREGLTWVGIWPHANVITAHFVTEINGLPFLVLDYAERGSLRHYLNSAVPVEVALTWAQHIAAGMVHLHTPDPDRLRPDPIIHRDLKPENILIDGTGFACITDFGLAKTQAAVAQAEALEGVDEEAGAGTAAENTRSQRYHTQKGSALGTPAYMAPEQWADASSAGPAADAYAFGMILGELLIGQHPLLPLDEYHRQEEWLTAHLAGLHRPLPSVFPLPMQGLYNSLLARNPAERPTLVEAFNQLQSTARQLGLSVYSVSKVFSPTKGNQAAFWQTWSDAYDRFGLYTEALVRSDQAYALEPQHPAILFSRADILAHLGRTDEALAMYAASVAARPVDDHRGRKIVLNQQGNLFNEIQRYAEAEEAYAAALHELPDAADTWRNRAINLRKWGEQSKAAGDEQQARDHFRQALKCARESWGLNPQDQNIPGTMARIGIRLDESQMHTEAEEAYGLAVQGELGSDAPAIWYNRALNLLQWGRGEVQAGQTGAGQAHLRAALAHAQEAQRLAPRDPDMPALIAKIQAALAQAQECGSRWRKQA